MSGGKGNAVTTTTVRHAPYIEAAHIEYLENVQNYRTWALVQDPISGDMVSSPYKNYVDLDFEDAFFGSGYIMSSFPSLYDMYGKFLAGLDIEVLFDQMMLETIDGVVVHDLISSEADILSDDLEQEALPRFETGMRDINSVMSSSFVVARGMMEVGRTKALSRFSADIRGRLMPIAVERWKTHLDWNRAVVETYAQIMKFYITQKYDTQNTNFEARAKNSLWPFTILEYERLAVGVLSGAQNITSAEQGASKAQKAIGGALSGAASGAMIGSVIPGIGTGIGALIGGVLGTAGGLL